MHAFTDDIFVAEQRTVFQEVSLDVKTGVEAKSYEGVIHFFLHTVMCSVQRAVVPESNLGGKNLIPNTGPKYQ